MFVHLTLAIKHLETYMDNEAIVTFAGLLLDILGVGVLFYSTSTKKIEAEISVELVRSANPKPGEEWLSSINYEDHMRALLDSQQRVRRNRRLQRVALVWTVIGFGLQAAALFV